MGLRQPSSTAAFFAQAKAGAEGQQQAREKLQKPQALGGSSQVGTSMVAAQTQAQKGATQQVQAAGQQAGKELKVDESKMPSATAMAVKKNANVVPSQESFNADISAKQARLKELDALTNDYSRYEGKFISDPNAQFGIAIDPQFLKQLENERVEKEQLLKDIPALQAKAGSINITSAAETGDIAEVERAAAATETEINNINNQINELNNQLQTASAEDAKKINEEKTRLDNILKSYQDKLTKENLGQIAQASTPETELTTREKLLATQGQDISKLAAIFGPNWNRKYGGLESQIYGKDLEALQQQAEAGLKGKEAAERESDVAKETYTKTLEEGKKGYETSIKSASDKLDILKKTPQELSTYSKDELTKLFGKDVDSLFNFDSNTGKVTGTKASATRKALDERLTKLTGEREKVGAAQNKVAQVASKQLQEKYMPVDKYGNPTGDSEYYQIKKAVNETDFTDQGKETFANLDNQFNNAIKSGNKKEADRIMGLMQSLRYDLSMRNIFTRLDLGNIAMPINIGMGGGGGM